METKEKDSQPKEFATVLFRLRMFGVILTVALVVIIGQLQYWLSLHYIDQFTFNIGTGLLITGLGFGILMGLTYSEYKQAKENQ